MNEERRFSNQTEETKQSTQPQSAILNQDHQQFEELRPILKEDKDNDNQLTIRKMLSSPLILELDKQNAIQG